jgi:hypothetical protein
LPLIRFFRGNTDLDTYLELDDSSIVSIANIAARQNWDRASMLAKRFLERDIYKCFEVPTENGLIPRNRLDRFRHKLNAYGITFVSDIISQRSYKQHAVTNAQFLKNILIRRSGEIASLGDVSDLLKAPARRSASCISRPQNSATRPPNYTQTARRIPRRTFCLRPGATSSPARFSPQPKSGESIESGAH